MTITAWTVRPQRTAFAVPSTMLALAMALGAPATVLAALVTVSFGGVVDTDPFGLGHATFTGSYTFDSAAPDNSPAATTGSYDSVGAPYGIAVAFDGGARLVSVSGALNVGIANNFAGPVDQYTVTGFDGVTTLGLFLEDNSASVFASDALPAMPPLLAAFSFAQLRWFDPGAEILGRIETLVCTAGCGDAVPLPEPASGALIGLALALLGATAGRSRFRVVRKSLTITS